MATSAASPDGSSQALRPYLCPFPFSDPGGYSLDGTEPLYGLLHTARKIRIMNSQKSNCATLCRISIFIHLWAIYVLSGSVHCKDTILKIQNKYSTLLPKSQFLHSYFCERFIYFPMIGLPIMLQENRWTNRRNILYRSLIEYRHMNAEIWTEAAQFLFWEYLNQNFLQLSSGGWATPRPTPTDAGSPAASLTSSCWDI